ncbi:TIP41-like protein isoform X1 [Tachypleus tridentatus]|uniref:TIP41-like protein isoform X1 n=1 Tax=Tachypleus tridentatus TaxID=6853 RepID=UPI003FD10183
MSGTDSLASLCHKTLNQSINHPYHPLEEIQQSSMLTMPNTFIYHYLHHIAKSSLSIFVFHLWLFFRLWCNSDWFQQELTLPQLPEMTFADNLLQIKHERGFGIEFNCLDALHLVDTKNDIMKVAVAEVWQNTRAECEYVKEVIKPFDWTFTTAYKGTLISTDSSLQVSETTERIDIEKLKVREKIMFFEDIHLFEDELADNGCAQCSVKIRVMQGSFFLLLRFFLRVDNILVRINDTRVYHEESKNYLLREYVSRESRISDLKVPSSLLTDPGELWTHLPIISSCYEKLEFPIC